MSPKRAPTQSVPRAMPSSSGSRPMAWWTRAAAVAVVSGNGGKAERDQRSHHHADRPVQVGLHRRSSAQENARFRDGQIVSASATAAPDAGTSDYDSYPVMALIISECRRLSQCPAVPEQLGAAHRRAGLPGFANVQWAALQDLFASAMDRLTVQPYTEAAS